MTDLHLHVDSVVLPHGIARNQVVVVQSGVIAAVGAPETPKTPAREERLDGILMPGFVDLQVNGAGGRSVAEATPAALEVVAGAVWKGGAIAFLPTLITAPFDSLLDQVAAVARWIDERDERPDAARPLGIHLEGPFLEEAGAHDPDQFVAPTGERVQALLTAGQDRVVLVTLAPGLPGAVAATAQLAASGVAVALGHGRSIAGFADCVAAGASLVTHLFNAMGPLHHRAPGLAGCALDDDRLCCSLILDGAHVDPVMVRNAFRMLGPRRTVLVTDAMPAAGMPDGEYSFGSIDASVRDGIVRDGEGRLAGSALTMDRAARNFLEIVPTAGPWTLAQAAATNPARLLAHRHLGCIAPGHPALFTLLEKTCLALSCR